MDIIQPEISYPDVFQDLFKPSEYKVYYGGRCGGKSWAFATALICHYGVQSPLRILCAREIQESITDSVKRILDDTIERYGLGNFYTSTNTEIRGANGTLFIFSGLFNKISKFKSKEGIDICWVEEADSISQDSLDTLLPTLRKDNSEFWFSFNPRNDSDPVYQMFVANDPPENSIVREVSFKDNPFFSEKSRKLMGWHKKHDTDKYNHVWLGKLLKQSQALIFKNWRVGNFVAPEGTIFYYGCDWGFSNDPLALIRCYFDDENRKLYIDYEAGGVGVELDDIPELFDVVPGSRKWKITADCSRPETISHLCRRGFNVVGSKKGAGSVEDGIDFLHNYEIIVHERCQNTRAELGLYSYKIDKKTGEILPLIVDKKNHYIDGLRYSIEDLWKPQVFI
jgi:phage terminase large subunit